MLKTLLYILICIPIFSFSQNNLLEEINTDSIGNQDISAVFKGIKIVNFESTKLISKGEFIFMVSHRFGSIENGFDSFFGLDNAVTRLNFVFGLSDAININASRSSFQKTYEASVKIRFISQQENGFPFTLVSYNTILCNTALSSSNLPKLEFQHRLGYMSQLLVSRKLNSGLSLELAPTFFHDNYVAIDDQDNSQFALGLGGRYKLGKRWSLNVDYGWHLNRAADSPYKNPLSIGVDIETGGHVFQLLFTNAQAMNTNGFLGQATGDWGQGDIYFGFNLTRIFN
ncbi:DUF5777 family beta-barrel protein [Gaetbulibacter aestuarii]|uniref:DUF5777 family beta-barrel protein n=1 Tax=Gaetbulibacter aestuarii TaxID=1502358 RepID=A0ABW7MWD8_9FLAO